MKSEECIMGAEQKYIDEIQKYDGQALLKLWRSHLDGSLGPSIWEAGKLFEYVVLRAFQIEGAIVRWPYSVQLDGEVVEQIDGAVSYPNHHILIECKDWAKGISIEPFAKMRNQLMQRPANVIGCIFSRSGYTDPAIGLSRFCSPQTILLWQNDELEVCIEHAMMMEAIEIKLRKAAEEFRYFYNVKPEIIIKTGGTI